MYSYIIQYISGGALLWETTSAPFHRSLYALTFLSRRHITNAMITAVQ